MSKEVQNDGFEIDIIDVEEFAKTTNGGKPPKARQYVFRVDKKKYTVDVESMTGREILLKAGKQPPEKWLLNQKFIHGQVIPIQLDQKVDFTTPGIERFTTLPKDQTDGRVDLAKDFALPEEDVAQLDANGYHWETVKDSANWLIVRQFPLPEGYTEKEVSVAIQIPSGYPVSGLDMAYFYPPIKRSDGKGIPATASRKISGASWQQWSRHYTPQHPWVAGEYNVCSHLALASTWLEREFQRG